MSLGVERLRSARPRGIKMFDFDVVVRQIRKAYSQTNCSWSLIDVIKVFKKFYMGYEEAFGMPHPHMKTETIRTIITDLPYINDEYGAIDVSPDCYDAMISSYFRTEFSKCNYSMAHFMSGDIRLMRFFEELY